MIFRLFCLYEAGTGIARSNVALAVRSVFLNSTQAVISGADRRRLCSERDRNSERRSLSPLM